MLKTPGIQLLLRVLLMVALYALPLDEASANGETEWSPVTITVQERSGIAVNDRVVRRGIPFAAAQLHSTENLRLRDQDGNLLPLQVDVLKHYPQGGIEWISVAFRPQLEANERRVYRLDLASDPDEASLESNGPRASGDGEAWVMENDRLRVEFGPSGVTQIYTGEVPILAAEGAGLAVSSTLEDDDTHTYYRWIADHIEIVEQGPVQTTVSMTGAFEGIAATAEWQLTLAAESSRLDHRFRLTSKADLDLMTAGIMMVLRPDFDPESVFDEGTLLSKPVLALSNEDSGLRLLFDAPDIDRFRGAVERSDIPGTPSNGFRVRQDSDGLRVLFAPIQYRSSWTWYDGVSRMTRLGMVLGGSGLDERAEVPAAFVAPEHFVAAGVLPSIHRSPSAKRAVAWTMGALNERDGHFEAGAIPQSIVFNEDGSVQVGGSASRPGETVYNLWYAQMQDGCPDLFRMLVEDTESWADVVVYRGSNDFFVGADRYGSLEQYGTFRFHTSHPYYGDASGLYLSYLMTGDPYFRETFELMTRYAVRTSNEYPTYGDYRVPRRFTWDGDFEARPFIESRNMMQARGLVYAEQMFGDEAFGEIAGQLAHWARHVQHEKGFWYQAYYDHGGPLTQRALDLPSAKNYIMLYGVRALVSLWDHLEAKQETADDGALRSIDRDSLEATETALIRFADYILDEQQAHGWLWDPISSGGDFAAMTNEDMRRGQMPRQEIMAIEVLEGVYRMTGEERYLVSLLEMLRYYLAIQQTQGGWSSRNQHREHEDGTVQGPFLGNNTAQFLRIAPRLQVLMENEEAKVRSLGFRDLVAVLSGEATDIRSEYTHEFDEREVGFNAFATADGRVLYLANYSGWMTGDWIKDVNLRAAAEPVLFEGPLNRITPGGVWVQGRLNQFERLFARETPITLTPENGRIEARIQEYVSDLLEIDVRGEGVVEVTVGDGSFAVDNENAYGIMFDEQPMAAVRPDNGMISFRLTLRSETRLQRLTVRPLTTPSAPR